MTTIQDPLGSPTIIYNRSGSVIIFLAPNDGTAFVDAVEIPHLAGETFVFINPPLIDDPILGAIKFASDFDIGDRVYVHATHISAVAVYTNDGVDPLPGFGGGGGFIQYMRVSPYAVQTWVQIS